MLPTSILYGEISGTIPEVVRSLRGRIVVVFDKNLASLSQEVVTLLDQLGVECLNYALPAGEQAKELSELSRLWDFLGEQNVNRNDTLLALGGGTVSDVVGFAAATWMRGIRYINIPTTLLAMVDASIGGKTAINSPFGKNLIGSFHSPQSVLIDTALLKTLSASEVANGLAEVAKCGFIHDPFILKLLETTPRDFEQLIQRSITVKQHYVMSDPHEEKPGVREILNYGHTLGHAIEKVKLYTMSHGQAIAIGMMFAAQLSHRLGFINEDLVMRHVNVLQDIGLGISIQGVQFDEVLPFMLRDKKNFGGKSRFILLKDLAQAEVVENIEIEILKETFDKVLA